MLKSDTVPHLEQFEGFLWKNKNCSNIEISDGHTGREKHTIIGKFTMKKSLTGYNFLKIKSQM